MRSVGNETRLINRNTTPMLRGAHMQTLVSSALSPLPPSTSGHHPVNAQFQVLEVAAPPTRKTHRHHTPVSIQVAIDDHQNHLQLHAKPKTPQVRCLPATGAVAAGVGATHGKSFIEGNHFPFVVFVSDSTPWVTVVVLVDHLHNHSPCQRPAVAASQGTATATATATATQTYAPYKPCCATATRQASC